MFSCAISPLSPLTSEKSQHLLLSSHRFTLPPDFQGFVAHRISHNKLELISKLILDLF